MTTTSRHHQPSPPAVTTSTDLLDSLAAAIEAKDAAAVSSHYAPDATFTAPVGTAES